MSADAVEVVICNTRPWTCTMLYINYVAIKLDVKDNFFKKKKNLMQSS